MDPILDPILEPFAGAWTLARLIEDFRAETVLRLEGQARLTPAEGGLAYEEEGTLALADGTRVAAARRYLWQTRGALIEILFEDGRPFHAFDPAQSRPAARHDCAPDDYEVAYGLEDLAGGRWTAAWRVRGPRKDYRMVSRYCRAAT